jgi:tol-pal system protein YbgF
MAVLVAASACGAGSNEQGQRRLQESVEDLRAQVRRQEDRIEELSNRVFVLADRVDSARVEASRPEVPPELEVVRLVPDEPEARPERTTAEPEADVVIALSDEGELAALPVKKVPPPLHGSKRPQAEASFRNALASYRQGRLKAAYAAFAEFLERFPRHAYADNARYWMGECRFDAKEYREAIRQFAQVIKRYPRSNKVPDALLKIGLAYERIGEAAMARRAFEDVVSSYPRSALADLARSHLASGPGGSR